MRAASYADPAYSFWGLVALTCAAAAGIGVLSVVSPVAGALSVGAVAALLILATGARLPSLFLALLTGLLITYAVLGRGGAYIGIAPLFVGDIGLAVAFLTVIATLHRARLGLLHGLLIAFAAWGLFRTVPYISRDGIDALRDGAIWAYAAYALAISFSLQRGHFPRLLSVYRKILPLFLFWVPIAAVVTLSAQASIPTIPGSDVQILELKYGDMAVHLAGAAGFILMGLYAGRSRGPSIAESLLWPVWFIGMAITGALSRAGLLAAGMAVLAALLLRPSRRCLPFLAIAVLFLGCVRLVDPTIDLGQDRKISFGQVTSNIMSVVSDNGNSAASADSSDGQLQGTKHWRTKWWGEIIGYTFQGPYFWTGKGFGINLADADGFQSDGSLRSPHNGHMTILARTGVPGFSLWILIQTTFAISLLRAFFRARGKGDQFWMQIHGWIFVYWLAMIINMSFDVYLEGPQGGIWFWSIFGLGLAALAAQRSAEAEALASSPAAR